LAVVADLMSDTLHKASVSTTVAEAATIMARGKVGSTLVMDGERLVGIFTERDIVRALSNSPDAPADPLGHWMTARPQRVSGSDPVEDALQRMVAGGFRHLPVVDEHGRVVGMLSMRDLVRAGVQGASAKV
jgi:CBS domain-containing protein